MFTELVDLLLQSKMHQVALSMLVIAIIATVLICLVEKKLGDRKRLDQERIFDLARSMNCSEYDIFMRAGEVWNFSEHKIEEDFARYLSSNELPHYVATYVRENERDVA
jgi:hypothetical protein